MNRKELLEGFRSKILQLRGSMKHLDFAVEIDVDPVTVNSWERCIAMPSALSLIKISDVYGVSTDWLLGLTTRKELRETPATWVVEYESENGSDPYGLFSRRYRCQKCGDWQTYGMTEYCPNCGKPMALTEPKDCHNCKHRKEDVRKCQPCLDAGCFPLWEDENG